VYLLGVGLFKESRPELVGEGGLQEGESSMDGGQTVIDQHLGPLAAPPKTEAKHAPVLVKALVRGHHSVEETFAQVQHAQTGHQPPVTCATNNTKHGLKCCFEDNVWIFGIE